MSKAKLQEFIVRSLSENDLSAVSRTDSNELKTGRILDLYINRLSETAKSLSLVSGNIGRETKRELSLREIDRRRISGVITVSLVNFSVKNAFA
jgi:hypothetical protein